MRQEKPVNVFFTCPHCDTHLPHVPISKSLCPVCGWPIRFPSKAKAYRGEDARVLYDQFKEETPSHKTMLAPEFWQTYMIWLEVKLLSIMKLTPNSGQK